MLIGLPSPKLRGRYRLDAVKTDGRKRPLSGWFDNLILDTGLDLVATTNGWLDYCHVGQGVLGCVPLSFNFESKVTDTELSYPIAVSNNRVDANSSASSELPYRGIATVTYRFAAGAITDEVGEVGVGTASTLFSRALIKNNDGKFSKIKVLSDEMLDVTYELSVYVPVVDVQSSILIAGAQRSMTVRAAAATNPLYWSPYRASSKASANQAARMTIQGGSGNHVRLHTGSLGGITSSPGGASEDIDNGVTDSYVEGSHKSVINLRFAAVDGIFNAKSMFLSLREPTGDGGNSFGAYQLLFDPVITKAEYFSFNAQGQFSWGRYDDS